MRAFSTISVYFNSQPHKEADTSRRQEVIDYVIISTHSLTRRLTLPLRQYPQGYVISTHSLTRRLTVKGLQVANKVVFQLTASQGG